MLYLFSHSTLPWVKFGYTRGDAWSRLPFWSNRHPRQLCGSLGAEHFTLLRCWAGELQTEALIKDLFPDRSFEFWPARYAADIVALVDLLQEAVSVPPRPPPQPETMERRADCDCGGTSHVCRECGRSFPRSIKLWQHIEDVHRATRARCLCGEQVIPRNLKRHQDSERCKRARASMDVR